RIPGMVPGIGLCRHAILKPSDLASDGFRAFGERLLTSEALPELAGAGHDASSLAAEVESGTIVSSIETALTRAGTDAQLNEGASARLLLCVDQLEELFTVDAVAPEVRRRFVSLLSHLARSKIVWIVATMRSDFFDHLVDHPELAEITAGEARYLLGP